MSQRIDSFIIREADGVRTANSLVLGRGLRVTETAGGLPELEGVHGSEVLLTPSGGDDTQAVNDALATGKDVRLGPGTFNITGSLLVGAADGQRLGGSGPAQTHVRLSATGLPAVVVTSGYGTVEKLRLDGVSPGAGNTGIRMVSPLAAPGPVTIRDVHIHNMQRGIHLEGVVCDVSRVVTWRTTEYGIYARGLRGTIRDVAFYAGDQFGIYVEGGDNVVCESIYAEDCIDAAVFISGGSFYRVSMVRAYACGKGIEVIGAEMVIVESLMVSASSGVYYANSILNSKHVAVTVCVGRGAVQPLTILGCTNVVTSAVSNA